MSDPIVDIEDEDALLRRVANHPDMVKRGEGRPTSAAFKPSERDGGLSVDVRRLLPDATDPTSVLDQYPEHGLVELRAAAPRELGLDVIHDPLPENYAHANIVPEAQMDRAAQRRAYRELARRCTAWVRLPAHAVESDAP